MRGGVPEGGDFVLVRQWWHIDYEFCLFWVQVLIWVEGTSRCSVQFTSSSVVDSFSVCVVIV